MSEMTPLQYRAAQAEFCFETAERVEGDEDSGFVRLKKDSPEWVTELVRSAHDDGEIWPDDWRYSVIRDAVTYIADTSEEDLHSGEFADSTVDVYTGRLLEWLASSVRRVSYCDEAAEEYLTNPKDSIVQRITIGQYMEIEEVYQSVLASLQAKVAAEQVSS